ncbi:hypothetical protein RRG08_031519 [Elysia crispata]|uniref:Uncharacterized protein n=1 Tax=Elysia crispata TaxID=231223 RepID=A0AAE0Z5J7_9GAST|nr:hypothetical protein RRG08_031519 [Elysia crispata]
MDSAGNCFHVFNSHFPFPNSPERLWVPALLINSYSMTHFLPHRNE